MSVLSPAATLLIQDNVTRVTQHMVNAYHGHAYNTFHICLQPDCDATHPLCKRNIICPDMASTLRNFTWRQRTDKTVDSNQEIRRAILTGIPDQLRAWGYQVELSKCTHCAYEELENIAADSDYSYDEEPLWQDRAPYQRMRDTEECEVDPHDCDQDPKCQLRRQIYIKSSAWDTLKEQARQKRKTAIRCAPAVPSIYRQPTQYGPPPFVQDLEHAWPQLIKSLEAVREAVSKATREQKMESAEPHDQKQFQNAVTQVLDKDYAHAHAQALTSLYALWHESTLATSSNISTLVETIQTLLDALPKLHTSLTHGWRTVESQYHLFDLYPPRKKDKYGIHREHSYNQLTRQDWTDKTVWTHVSPHADEEHTLWASLSKLESPVKQGERNASHCFLHKKPTHVLLGNIVVFCK